MGKVDVRFLLANGHDVFFGAMDDDIRGEIKKCIQEGRVMEIIAPSGQITLLNPANLAAAIITQTKENSDA